jgi:hypothetical protein
LTRRNCKNHVFSRLFGISREAFFFPEARFGGILGAAMALRWGCVDYPRPKIPFEYYRGCRMAWLEQRGDKFRIAFRFRGKKFRVNLKATEPKEANGCLARMEETHDGRNAEALSASLSGPAAGRSDNGVR